MKPDDPKLQWIKEPELGLAGKSVLAVVRRGLVTTIKHLFSRKKTVQFPDDARDPRAAHLSRCAPPSTATSRGRVKCVACSLCHRLSGHCIDIVAAESPGRPEKYPQSFTIDELRCIYCGMCEEACPVDAIELTSLYDLSGKSREEMVFDKEKLLSVYDQTKDREPMKSAKTAEPPEIPKPGETP